MHMKKWILSMGVLFMLYGCGSVPLTGRKQLLLVSDQEVLSASLTQYSDYMKTAKKSTSSKDASMVTRVGKKIAAATETYLRQNGLESEIKNFAWEFNLVKDDQVNAFCMPGGKIVVYEGLMDLVSSDDELAVVDKAKETCDKVVVLLNTSCTIEVDPLVSGEHAVDAIAYVGIPNDYQFKGIVDVLGGEKP